jgi:hypothetical protein
MSVSDFDSRRLATSEFLTEGLGGKLTRSAELLLRASAEDSFGDWKNSAITYACGNIVERVLWIGYGRWMGYFEDVAPISADERGLLREYAPLLSDANLPADVQNIQSFLINPDTLLNGSFFRQYFPGPPLDHPVPEWYPVFQAVLIASEYLTQNPITSFFLFLRDGNIEKFQERALSPDAVLNALRDDHHVYPYFGEHAWRESVVAGFIRYTEFLSAMGNIFPTVNTESFAETSDIPARIVDRDILYSVVRPFRWRFPGDQRALATYHTVFKAFRKLTAEEFAKYPEMGVQWSEAETYSQVIRLSQQFFDTDDRAEGQEDPMFVLERQRRSAAVDSKLRELGGEGFEPR